MVTVRRQAIGQDAAGRPRTDDHIVESLLTHAGTVPLPRGERRCTYTATTATRRNSMHHMVRLQTSAWLTAPMHRLLHAELLQHLNAIAVPDATRLEGLGCSTGRPAAHRVDLDHADLELLNGLDGAR